MQYRYLTKDKLKISLLGFGTMRFPIVDNDSSKIDEVESSSMLDYALDNGVNYIDTAYPYHQGQSEVFLGKYLKNGKRDKVYLATKLPVWLVEKYEDFERLLDEQLNKLQTDHIDFYLLHSLHEKVYRNIIDLKVFDFLEDAKRKGKIKYIGFSFHDELPLFKEIVDAYPWDFCQIQLNYMDRQYQAGIEGLKYAKDRDIDVIIMEPLKGGKLASASDEVADIISENHSKYTPAEWALRWLYNFEELSVVLSGMSTMEQVKENIEITERGITNSLSSDELSIIDRVTEFYESRIKVGCTGCEYCLPCPSNVLIPNIFTHYNNIYVYGTKEQSIQSYKNIIKHEKDVSKCIECGVCEQICPQHLNIISLLKDAQKALI